MYINSISEISSFSPSFPYPSVQNLLTTESKRGKNIDFMDNILRKFSSLTGLFENLSIKSEILEIVYLPDESIMIF